MRPSPVATSLNSSEDILDGSQELGPTTGTANNINEGKFILASPAAEGDHLFITCNKAGAFRAKVEVA
jgi:hypothetical protein